ncbi:MAG TPA: hypothetical protein VHD56_17385 [Tepidisphaeraceae bacterium]|jgi:hypothetical protein|nr:hypothetical protein [Tepidisphaeraceae bacterium]
MDEEKAEALAKALGGETWQSGGGIWLVQLPRADGRLVVVSDDAVCEYETEAAFEAANPSAAILLR